MKLNFTNLLPTGALLCIVLASCKKNDAVISTPTNVNATRTTNMIGAMSDESDLEFADLSKSDAKSTTNCSTISYDPSKDVYPHTKIRDYGTGCTNDDGITRSGKKFVTEYADKYTAPAGKTISITTFSDYYVNGVKINGSVKISVVNSALNGPLKLKVITSKTSVDENGNSSSYVSVAYRTQTEGINTEDEEDDVFSVTENAYGTEVDNDAVMTTWGYKTDNANPIIKAVNCSYRSQGALIITIKQNSNQYMEYLDYGNGGCDKNATLSVDGGTPQPVTLPFHFFGAHL